MTHRSNQVQGNLNAVSQPFADQRTLLNIYIYSAASHELKHKAVVSKAGDEVVVIPISALVVIPISAVVVIPISPIPIWMYFGPTHNPKHVALIKGWMVIACQLLPTGWADPSSQGLSGNEKRIIFECAALQLIAAAACRPIYAHLTTYGPFMCSSFAQQDRLGVLTYMILS